MMMRIRLLALVICAFLVPAFVSADDAIRVLSINIRLSHGRDGENAWPKRKEFTMDVIRKAPDGNGPYDFVGTQEAVVHPDENFNQVAYITKNMPEYDSIHLSREATPDKGECMLLLWRKERWRIDETDQGTFWLSATPDVPGSKTDPDAGCPRIVTFGLFHQLQDGQPTGKKVYVYNTHYDHMSEIARLRGARILMDRIATRKEQNVPIIAMGDLNCGEKSDAIRYMQGASMIIEGKEITPPTKLTDTFRAAQPDATDVGTFHGFKTLGPEKIDYIFITSPLKTVSANIIRTMRDGRYPTDHFPVEAVVEFATESGR